MRWRAFLIVALAVAARAQAADSLYEGAARILSRQRRTWRWTRGEPPSGSTRGLQRGQLQASLDSVGGDADGDDLFGTISRGIPGSGMPSFATLTREERQSLVRTVDLSRPPEGGDSYFRSRPSGPAVEVPSRPPAGAAILAKGASLP